MDSLRQAINAVNKAIENSKKLTTQDRKKLSKSVFCGPGRSFPTPDCAHIRAAKVYLGRSKFSQSAKQKIAACINRRAQSLKCNVTKKAKADLEFKDLSFSEQALMECEVFKATRELVEKSLNIESMDLDFSDVVCEI